jgi:hypothetical protein
MKLMGAMGPSWPSSPSQAGATVSTLFRSRRWNHRCHRAEGEGDDHGTSGLRAGSHRHSIRVAQGVARPVSQEPPLENTAIAEYEQDISPPAGPEEGSYEAASRLRPRRLSERRRWHA